MLHCSLREYIAGPTTQLLSQFDIHDIETTVRTLQAITRRAADDSSSPAELHERATQGRATSPRRRTRRRTRRRSIPLLRRGKSSSARHRPAAAARSSLVALRDPLRRTADGRATIAPPWSNGRLSTSLRWSPRGWLLRS